MLLLFILSSRTCQNFENNVPQKHNLKQHSIFLQNHGVQISPSTVHIIIKKYLHYPERKEFFELFLNLMFSQSMSIIVCHITNKINSFEEIRSFLSFLLLSFHSERWVTKSSDKSYNYLSLFVDISFNFIHILESLHKCLQFTFMLCVPQVTFLCV